MNDQVFYLDQASFFAWVYKILYPVEWLMTQILFYFHKALTFIGFQDGPGVAWVLSIMLLVIFVRLCILPLFIKQMNSMRKLQAIQPKLQHIQAKYKGKTDQASREAMNRETMKLYQDAGANPMGSCVPALFQGPVFMAMFYTLTAARYIALDNGAKEPFGAFTVEVAKQIEGTSLFGVSLADMFPTADTHGKVIIGIFIALMCLTMFLSQYYNLRRNLPRASMEGPQYSMQRSMAFIFPVMYIFSGVMFPSAVLVYWLTNNLWTLGQVIWQVHNMPTPGSPAHEAKEIRDRKKEEERRERKGLPTIEEEALAKAKEAQAAQAEKGHQRQQPKRNRSKPKSKR
ncbi:membrane protein insertase YidC [Bifidobacterium margollesii]